MLAHAQKYRHDNCDYYGFLRMAVKKSDISYHSAYDYIIHSNTDSTVTNADYIKLLLQKPFDYNGLNILLFIHKAPVSYCESNLAEFLGYLTDSEKKYYQDTINHALNTGYSFKESINDFCINGMPTGKAYIVTVQNQKELNQENRFLHDNLKSISERAKKFKEYCDLIQDPFWIRNKNLDILFVNHAFLNIVNAPDIDTVIHNNLWLCDTQKSVILGQLALQKNDVQTMNITYVKNGNSFSGAITETPVVDDEGNIFLFGRLYDKTTETELKTKVNHLELGIKEILTNISVAASLFDKHRRLRFYNQAFVNLWGLTPDYLDTAPDHVDILDKLQASRLIPESRDYKSWREQVLLPYRDIKAHYEDIWYTPQNKTIKCSVSAYSDGGIVCLQENVTDYILLEQSHHILTDNLRNTLNALDEGIILCDASGRIKVTNTKITDIFAQDNLLGSHITALLDSPKKNPDFIQFIQKIYGFIQNGFTDNNTYTQECHVEGCIFIASVVRLSTSDILIHIRDHTALLNYQKMLYDNSEMLKENEHIRESFFRRISHNLRDPMTAVAGFAELLQTEIFGTLNEKQKDYIADMRYSIDDLLRLTDNLADLVRLDSSQIHDFQEISLRKTLVSAIESMQNEAFGRNITFYRMFNDDDTTIKGDSALLKQAFIQILENALFATPRGGNVIINMICNDTQTMIQILDQGKGMNEPIMNALNESQINDIKGYGLRYVLRVMGLHNASCQAKIIHTDLNNSGNTIAGTEFNIVFS